jgi:chromatin assembly factor 1 subunit B
MSSSDGFCSCLSFSPGELGQVYEGKVPATPTARITSLNTAQSSSHPTPNITPITPIGPSLPRQQSITSAFSNARPASPARSMSTASSVGPFAVPNSAPSAESTFPLGPPNSASALPGSGPASGAATPNHQSQSSTNAILMHPTPSFQNVPSVAAAHSGPVPSNVPTWMTPPETPIPPPPSHARTHSASSSVSGFKGDGQDIRPTTEVDLPAIVEDGATIAKRSSEVDVKGERPGKKRRIEPTLVSAPERN